MKSANTLSMANASLHMTVENIMSKTFVNLGHHAKFKKFATNITAKTCKKTLFEGFCIQEDHCAYSHKNLSRTNGQKNISVIMRKMETLEKVVKQMA